MNKILCAWCGTTMRDGIEPISHGCCADCAPRVAETLAGRLKLSLKVIASAQALAWDATPLEQKRKFMQAAEHAMLMVGPDLNFDGLAEGEERQ